MLYDTCNYHILYYSKLINVHPITTVLKVNLTSKRMNNSCALLRQNSTTYDQCTLKMEHTVSQQLVGIFLVKIESYLN